MQPSACCCSGTFASPFSTISHHIYDLAQAHRLVLRALADSDHCIYNLGTGTGYSIREVIAAAGRLTGREVPFHFSPRRPGDPATPVASSEKIRRELGWFPRYPTLDEIIASALP